MQLINSTTTIRWLIVVGLLGAVVAFFALGWPHQFTLDALKPVSRRSTFLDKPILGCSVRDFAWPMSRLPRSRYRQPRC